MTKDACYHPRSCGRCDRAGQACERHHVGDEGHDMCTGQASTAPRYVVCVQCEGSGYQSLIGVFTSSDLDEAYGDDFEEREAFTSEYMREGGAYDERCEACKGKRVMSPAELEAWNSELQYRAECAAESRYFGNC